MDESTWKFAQIIMWIIGGQTAIFGFIFLFIWNQISKLGEKLSDVDKRLNEKISDIDKRLYGIETVLHMKDCCMLKQDQNLKKAE